jgi:hypothetical protein
MALPNLTGQNIQDTYQRVLQTDGGIIRDGTGSLVEPTVANLTVTSTGSFGRIEVLHISSSTGDFDANTIRIGGTSFNKSDLDTLKEGKTINTTAKDLKEGDTNKTNIIRPDAIMHPNDDSTYSKYTTTGRINAFVSGTLFHDLNLNGSNNYARIGDGTSNIILSGSVTASSYVGNLTNMTGTVDGGTF